MLPEVKGLQFTRAQMLFYTFILLPIPLLLFVAKDNQLGNADYSDLD